MGCLNSQGQFEHWFANIHFSGPCNRSCYFCIGQHMMELDPLNNLDEWPLKNLDEFIDECNHRNINEINLTGSNTDPLLYKHLYKLHNYLCSHLSRELNFGLRTNGVGLLERPGTMALFDRISLSITSLDPEIYRATMGQGEPPDIEELVLELVYEMGIDLKMNVVLTPETVDSGDVESTVLQAAMAGVPRINLREPYGQPHIGDPLRYLREPEFLGYTYGMPTYQILGSKVTYWDVHYVEVESVNLYANGVISADYPVTRGHSPENGEVKSQGYFPVAGRHRQQWLKEK